MKFKNDLYALLLSPILLSRAELPPIVVTTTFLNELTLGGSGEVWLKIPSNVFYAAYFVETYPNGTKKIGPGTSYAINASHPALDSNGALSLPYNSTTSENCVQSSSMGEAHTGLIWVPEVVGNWILQTVIVFFYSSGPHPYRYPNSTTVCIDPPFKSEQANVATFNVTVRSNGDTSTINPSTLNPVIIGGEVSTTTIALPTTFTGSPFRSWALRSVTSNGLRVLSGIMVIVLIVSN